MAAVKKALADGKLTRAEARDLRPAQLERAQERVAASPDTLRIGTGAQNYISTVMPKPSGGGGGANTGGGAGSGVNTAGGGSNQQAAASNAWQQNDILKYASGKDRDANYNTLLTNSGMEGAFDGAAWSRAQAAGFSDQQIYDALSQYDGKGSLMIGTRVKGVMDNWVNDNPNSYRAFANGAVQSTSQPGTVTFNPLGVNIGLGTGGLQDVGVSWSSKQGYGGDDFSQYQSTPTDRANMLDSGFYMKTPEGYNRVINGEAPQPYRYMGDKMGNPDSEGGIAYGYDQFQSPAAQAYLNNLNYKGSWMMPRA